MSTCKDGDKHKARWIVIPFDNNKNITTIKTHDRPNVFRRFLQWVVLGIRWYPIVPEAIIVDNYRDSKCCKKSGHEPDLSKPAPDLTSPPPPPLRG